MCLILRQGVGEHAGLFTDPSIVSNALPCQTLDIFGVALAPGELGAVELLGSQRQT